MCVKRHAKIFIHYYSIKFKLVQMSVNKIMKILWYIFLMELHKIMKINELDLYSR